MALTDKLSAIGAAIREKTGGTELLTLDAMPAEIASITSGGGELTAAKISRSTTTSFDVSNYVENGKNFVLFFTYAKSSSYSRYVYFGDTETLGSINTATPTSTGINTINGSSATAIAQKLTIPTTTLVDGVLTFGSGTIGTYAILYYAG